MPTRRQVLLGAAGVVGVAGLAGIALVEHEWPAPSSQRVPAPRDPSPTDAIAETAWVASTARGRRVRLVVVTPPEADRARLPVVLGLHGLGANALFWADPGSRGILGDAWVRGVPGFALVAVDGGDNYWHPYRAGDDPMRMLLDEVPAWLADRGVGTDPGLALEVPLAPSGPVTPVAVTGVSMGGAGALLYARERVRRARPVAGVAAVSPGLFTDWRVAARRPFAGPADWAAHDPLRFHPELAGVPTGIWCGAQDPFADAARRYLALARPEVGVIAPGRHDGVFYGGVLPDVVAFLGRHVRAAADRDPRRG